MFGRACASQDTVATDLECDGGGFVGINQGPNRKFVVMVFMVEDEYRGRLNEGILRGSFWVSIEIDPVINVVDTQQDLLGHQGFSCCLWTCQIDQPSTWDE